MSYQPSTDKGDSGINITIERPRPQLPPPAMGTIHDVEIEHTPPPPATRQQTRYQLADRAVAERPLNDRSDPSNPFSPFYDHAEAPTTLSLQEPPISKQNTKMSDSTKVYDSDLEAAWTESKANMLDSAITKTKTKDCTVWPGQKALKDAKRAEKMNRRGECWNPMRGMDAKKKFWLKVLIAMVLVGAAVGIGLGISRAVGAGIWKPQDH